MDRSKARTGLGAGGAALGVTVLFAPPADATTFPVMSTGDGGADTLRQAVLDANANAGPDIITFASSVTGEIDLTNPAMAITDPVDVQGPGADTLTVKAQA